MKIASINIAIVLTVAVISFIVTGCSFDDSGDDAKNMETSLLIDPTDITVTRSEETGNLVILNNTGEELIISESNTFTDSRDVVARFSRSSIRISTLNNGTALDTVKLYAAKSSDIIALRQDLSNTKMDNAKVVQSPLFTRQYGGSWNPFGAGLGVADALKGWLVLCNNTDHIVGLTLGAVNNTVEALINRKDCGVRVSLPADGLLDVNFVNMDDLSLIESQTIGLNAGQTVNVNIGEADIIVSPAKLFISNLTPYNFSLNDVARQQPLLNDFCNVCSVLTANGQAQLTLVPNREYTLSLTNAMNAQVIEYAGINIDSDSVVALVLKEGDEGVYLEEQSTFDFCLSLPFDSDLYQQVCTY